MWLADLLHKWLDDDGPCTNPVNPCDGSGMKVYPFGFGATGNYRAYCGCYERRFRWRDRVLNCKKVITGCEDRGDKNSPYLTRITLLERGWLWLCVPGKESEKLCLHIFHRSDSDDAMHDHPFDFWTLVLWRGYIEVMPGKRRRLWPGMIVFRRAEHTHRVELVNGKRAITLVWLCVRRREWGFHLKNGQWEQWQQYFRRRGC